MSLLSRRYVSVQYYIRRVNRDVDDRDHGRIRRTGHDIARGIIGYIIYKYIYDKYNIIYKINFFLYLFYTFELLDVIGTSRQLQRT